MPRRETYVPKHRGPNGEPAVKKGLRRSLVFSGVAVAATGLAVSSGIALNNDDSTAASAALASADVQSTGAPDSTSNTGSTGSTGSDASAGRPIDLGDRTSTVSRSDRRTSIDAKKKAALSQASGGQATATEDLARQDPRTIARTLMPQFGFGPDQFGCLDSLYMSESGWNIHADNPTSSAYGIPQALPGAKMASAGPDWQDNAATQIKWGLGYIRDSYGTPCNAWSFKQGHNWY